MSNHNMKEITLLHHKNFKITGDQVKWIADESGTVSVSLRQLTYDLMTVGRGEHEERNKRSDPNKDKTENSKRILECFHDLLQTRKRNLFQVPFVEVFGIHEHRETEDEKVTLFVEFVDDFLHICGLIPDQYVRLRGRLDLETDNNEAGPVFDVKFKLGQATDAPLKLLELPKADPLAAYLLEPTHERYQATIMNFTIIISFGWPEILPSTFSSDHTFLENLMNDHKTKDFTVVVGNGNEVKCHGVILSAHCEAFKAMVSNGMIESQTRRIEMKDVSNEGIAILQKYMYGLEIPYSELGSEMALELFEVADKYKLVQLEKAVSQLFIVKGNGEWFQLNTILDLYGYIKDLKRYEWLRDHLLRIINKLPPCQLEECDRFKEFTPSEKHEFVWKLYLLCRQSSGFDRATVEKEDHTDTDSEEDEWNTLFHTVDFEPGA